MKWEILSKNKKDITKTLLNNRKIKNKDEFFSPRLPSKVSLKSLGIKESEIKKSISRIKKAKKNGEQVIVYGDYDADGICATAIMWEALHGFRLDVLPHIPDRFEEGYGINATSIENLKSQIPNLKLIVTVDNGIVGYGGIETAKKLGIDVVVIDHHTKGTKPLKAYSIIHSSSVCGSALAWFFSRELLKKVEPLTRFDLVSALELAAIGTIADQMPLTGVNRSVVKFGLAELSNTKRPGLLALFKEVGLIRSDPFKKGSDLVNPIGTYEVNYMIAPRINAMGRLANGIDSLRLLCTKKADKALELSKLLTKTNVDRQKVVDVVVTHALSISKGKAPNVIVLAHETYHEGVIGLAAGKLAEQFYRPAIVFSKKGDISKASARSIPGFNIIEAIRSTGLILEGGGHPMAAGFSLETKLISKFTKKINELARDVLTDELLERKLKIDLEIDFSEINPELVERIKGFSPTGIGNPTPTFASYGTSVIDSRTVGNGAKHLKLKLKQNEHIFDSIYFGGGEIYSKLAVGTKVDIAYQVDENVWNGRTSLQLKIKDVKI